MSDTPETDAFMTRIRGIDGDKHWVPANTARRLERERDDLKIQLKVMQAERDVARISARKSDEAHDRVIGDLERADVMAEKAKELIARWDQPSWKDSAPTAGFIYALRDAVEAYEKTPK